MMETLATLAAGLFAGAAIYINVAEHPARLTCETDVAVKQFRPSYKRAAVMQASLAALGFLLATAAWLTGAHWIWLLGGLLLVSVIPFTLVIVMPVNKQLLDPGLDTAGPAGRALLKRWGALHGVRSGASLIAFILFLWALQEA